MYKQKCVYTYIKSSPEFSLTKKVNKILIAGRVYSLLDYKYFDRLYEGNTNISVFYTCNICSLLYYNKEQREKKKQTKSVLRII